MKSIFCVLITLFSIQISMGQAGAKFYTGLVTAVNRDNNVTPSGAIHSGYVFGIDGRLNSDRMYFLIGGQYGNIDLLSTKSPSFVSGEKLWYGKGRIGLGFDIIKISRKFFVTGKLLGGIIFNGDYDANLIKPNTPYDKLNDGTATITGGLGVRLGIFSADFEYDYGLFNQYFEQPNTHFDYYSLTVGVNF